MVLGAGMVLAALVILEVWHLYRAPGKLAEFAAQVESVSGVDQALSDFVGGASQSAPGNNGQLRLSYYLSWILVLLLLSLLTRLAFGCIREGGRILLEDLRDTTPQEAAHGRHVSKEATQEASEDKSEPKTVVPRFRSNAPQRQRLPAEVAKLRERSGT